MMAAVYPINGQPAQCCALNKDGSRCLADGHQGWHLCLRHMRVAQSGVYLELVQEVADQSPIQQRSA